MNGTGDYYVKQNKLESERKISCFSYYVNSKKGDYYYTWKRKEKEEEKCITEDNGGWISSKYMHAHWNTIFCKINRYQ